VSITLRISIASVVFGLTLPISSSAASSVVQVNANGKSCQPSGGPVYTTIQEAVTAVASGGTVLVCPGSYAEQVAISQPLTLRGVRSGDMGAAVVVPPPTGLKVLPGTSTLPQIFAYSITTGPVTIENLTVDAANNLITDCTTLFEGVYFKDAFGTVNHVAARNQTATSGGNDCNNGFGIRVYGDVSNSTVVIENSSVRSYDLDGIIAQDAFAAVTIKNNSVIGPGALSNPTFGIWMLDGATGTVSGNSVADNSVLSVAGSAGILIQGSHGVQISGNTLGNNAYGIKVVPDIGLDANNGTVTGNTVLGSGLDGIYVCSNNNSVQGNSISASAESGVNLASVSNICSANNNIASNNTVNEACAGILIDPSVTGNATSPNRIFNATTLQLMGTTCPSSGRKVSDPTKRRVLEN
jgi:parallel beta-helix repeat protein